MWKNKDMTLFWKLKTKKRFAKNITSWIVCGQPERYHSQLPLRCQKYADLFSAHFKQNVMDVAAWFFEHLAYVFQTFFHNKFFQTFLGFNLPRAKSAENEYQTWISKTNTKHLQLENWVGQLSWVLKLKRVLSFCDCLWPFFCDFFWQTRAMVAFFR